MSMVLFVGGPWSGQEREVFSEALEWKVPVVSAEFPRWGATTIYVRRRFGAVIDGQRYAREVMMHPSVRDPDAALFAALVSRWVKDGGERV